MLQLKYAVKFKTACLQSQNKLEMQGNINIYLENR